jgi:16S rRNA (guanine1207-N2)-methyltransferase
MITSSAAPFQPEIRGLLLPFAQGLLTAPQEGTAFFLRAKADAALAGWRQRLVCEQTFRPDFERLQAQGFQVVPRLSSGEHSLGLCLLSKHKAENLANLGRAWTRLAPGRVLVCSGLKEVGAGSIERLVAERLGTAGNLYKHHCRVFWSVKPAGSTAPAEWLDLDRLAPSVEGTYQTRPGIFSADQIDAGSRLLVENLPADVAGEVADLGSGWGYLTIILLRRYPAVRRVDLFEAELVALEASQANLTAESTRTSFHWHDVAAGLPRDRRYDWIVMNPPFHVSKHTDIGLGRAFIATAAAALRNDGRLVLVANRQLPYEHTLRDRFGQVATLVQTNGYKVLLARGPSRVR